MKKHRFHEALAISVICLSLGVLVLFLVQESSPDFLAGITGYATSDYVPTTVNVTQAYIDVCNFTLVSGWNLVSFYCLFDGIPRDNALSSINDVYSAIFVYYPADSSDPWKSYNPDLPSWVVHDLEDMSRKWGYWIYMDSVAGYNYTGIRTLNNTMPLIGGWNLRGYTSPNDKNASDAFSSINGSYTAVAIYNESSGFYLYYYSGDPASSDFNITVPYEGYWINATGDVDWVLSW